MEKLPNLVAYDAYFIMVNDGTKLEIHGDDGVAVSDVSDEIYAKAETDFAEYLAKYTSLIVNTGRAIAMFSGGGNDGLYEAIIDDDK